RSVTRPNLLVFYGLLAAGIASALALAFVFPNLHNNVPFLALVTLTPFLSGLTLALWLSGLGRRLPGPTQNLVRGALAFVIVLDLIVYAGPLFVSGATGHDTTPAYTTPAPQASATGVSNGRPTSTPSTQSVTRSGQFDHRAGVDTVAGTATL